MVQIKRRQLKWKKNYLIVPLEKSTFGVCFEHYFFHWSMWHCRIKIVFFLKVRASKKRVQKDNTQPNERTNLKMSNFEMNNLNMHSSFKQTVNPCCLLIKQI
jgi:hypothetical protein